MTIRIVLADDHGVLLDALRATLDREPDMEVVGTARDGADALATVRQETPEVVVMDVSMPGMNGIEATRRILTTLPETRILCLSMHAEVRLMAAVLDAGAAGYVVKECLLEELIGAVRTVHGGHTYLSPSIAGLLVGDYKARRRGEDPGVFSLLTAREREVLQLLAEGHSTKAIAGRLHISAKTVGTHREHLMSKLELGSVAELTKYAIREGLTSVDPYATP